MRSARARLSAHRCLAELQHIETRAVGDGFEDGLGGDRSRRQQQRELLDFLMRGEQIAFDTFGQQRRGGGVGLQLVAARRSRIQAGRRGRSIGQTCTSTPCFSIALHPARVLRAAVDLAGDHQHQRVGRRLLARARRSHRRPARPASALAMRISMILRWANSDIERLSASRRLPIEAALDDMQLALGEPCVARLRADRIRGLVDEQRLVAGDQIDRLRADGPGWPRGCRRKSSLSSARRGRRAAASGAAEDVGNEGRQHSLCDQRVPGKLRPIMDQAARRGHRERHAAPVAAFRCIRPQARCVAGLPDGACRASVAETGERAG